MVQLFKHPKETGLRISIRIQYSKYLSKRVPKTKYPDEYNILNINNIQASIINKLQEEVLIRLLLFVYCLFRSGF